MADSRDDRVYFTLRAEQERAIASICEDNSAALAHFHMADEYDRRAAEMERAAKVDI